jgi:hypothetical protein
MLADVVCWREAERPAEIDAPGTALHFNLAHSAGLVGCAPRATRWR